MFDKIIEGLCGNYAILQFFGDWQPFALQLLDLGFVGADHSCVGRIHDTFKYILNLLFDFHRIILERVYKRLRLHCALIPSFFEYGLGEIKQARCRL